MDKSGAQDQVLSKTTPRWHFCVLTTLSGCINLLTNLFLQSQSVTNASSNVRNPHLKNISFTKKAWHREQMGETPKDHIFLFYFTLLINLFFMSFYQCALNQQGRRPLRKEVVLLTSGLFYLLLSFTICRSELKFSEQYFFFLQTIMVIFWDVAQS